MPLNRVSIISPTVKIVTEFIPNLTGLDLSNNKITALGIFKDFVKATLNMTHLDLSLNEIHSVDYMDQISSWKNMRDIVLHGNALKKPFDKKVLNKINTTISYYTVFLAVLLALLIMFMWFIITKGK